MTFKIWSMRGVSFADPTLVKTQCPTASALGASYAARLESGQSSGHESDPWVGKKAACLNT